MCRCVCVITTVLALISSVGCGGASYEGPPRVAVTGTVNFNGQPLAEGNIFFVGDGELRQADGVIANGKFEIPEDVGPNAGSYQVRILSYQSAGGAGADAGDSEVGSEETDELVDDTRQIIPAMYNQQTSLTAEVSDGMEPLVFDLSQ